MKVSIARSLKYLFHLPKEALYILSGKLPITVENKTLDSGLQIVVAVMNILPGFETLGPIDARKAIDALAGLIDAPMQDIPVAVNKRIPVTNPEGYMPIRIYIPSNQENAHYPVLVYSHGGGYVMASLDSHERICQLFSKKLNCIVASLGYRLAPEFTFPSAAYDVIAGFKWVKNHISDFGGDIKRIAIGGDSAGATLSTVACHELKNTEYKPFYQLLFYPGTNASRMPKSRDLYGEGLFLTGKQIDWFISQYLPNREDAYSPLVSPMLYSDFSNLPPTYISTAGLDPVFDDGYEYAQKLKEANNKLTYKSFPSLIHGYVNMTAIPACMAAVDDAIEELRKAFYT